MIKHFPWNTGYGDIIIDLHRNLAAYHDHTHEYTELVLYTRGRGVHIINGKRYPVKAGDVYIINPGTSHACEKSGDLDRWVIGYHSSIFLLIGSDIRTLSAFQTLFVLAPRSPDEQFTCRLTLSPKKVREAVAVIQRMKRESVRRASGYRIVLRSLFAELAVLLCRSYGHAKSGTVPAIARAAAHIEANYAKDVSLASLAAVAGISGRHCARLFTAMYGRTPAAYLIETRIRHACTLLSATGESITDIAFSCGYHDSSFFTRQFKKTTGVMPSVYRRSHSATK